MPTQTSKQEQAEEANKTAVPKKKSTKPKTVSAKATSKAKQTVTTSEQEPVKKKRGRPPKKPAEVEVAETKKIDKPKTKTTTKSTKTKVVKENEAPAPKAKTTTTAKKKTTKQQGQLTKTTKTAPKEKNTTIEATPSTVKTKTEPITYSVQRKNGKTKKTTTLPKEPQAKTEETVVVEIEDELLTEQEEIKVVTQERKQSKTLTNQQKAYMKKEAMHNAVAAIITTAYFVLLTLAFTRMEPSVFSLDLKVFSSVFAVTTILLWEHAYKKDNGKWAIHGIEMLVVAIMTLLLTHWYTIATTNFTTITLVAAGSCIVYYSIKCLIMVIRQIRKSKLQDVKTLLIEKNEKISE